ncbi:TonB-dependent receptor [Vreelandella subglaciescola]|uniref:Catecholate siderophore receptor n=1 Tax=Vreelandella subglaciescola TaxID=29571 RepID=A0A1M7HRI4_9GAMM|nr:TonB-dependent siderophore receptor [Halomonas subglaciescola]SHM30953.1 catecholate siderophore receptor [Halomonas subglaciescola]
MNSGITATRRSPYRAFATAASFAVASTSMPAMAQATEATELDAVTVVGEQNTGYKAEYSASDKFVKPLLDTPQTVTTVPEKVIEEQQALSLRQVLSNVSGITFDAGEGGGGSGDKINIRGFSANANLKVDGLRDSSQNNRTDLFNVERVEVVKGPSSVFGGAGTTGGVINMISKTPQQRDFVDASTGLGTDDYHRVTLDANQTLEGLGTNSAFRLNLMGHENDKPGRDEINEERFGIAPSLTVGLSDATRATLSYVHQKDDNLLDYGLPAKDGEVLPGVDHEAFYGWSNLDGEEIQSDIATLQIEHNFSGATRLENKTRYTQLDRDTTISAPHADMGGLAPGRYKPAGPQAYRRDVTTEMWINQTQLSTSFNTGSLAHELLVGAEFSRETYDRTASNLGLGSAEHPYPDGGYDMGNPPGHWDGGTTYTARGANEATLENQAIYAFDTVSLNPQWDLSFGLRHDWIDGEAVDKDDNERTTTSDSEFSGRTGVVYKPATNGRVYLAYGTSFSPSAENLATSGSLGRGNGADKLSPEKSKTWELGTKWELMDGQLGLTGALFRVDKDNVREQDGNGDLRLAGEQRVQGVELGMTGELTDAWQLYANYTYLDSETLKSIASAQTNGRDPEGHALGNTPEHSVSLWSTYDISQTLQVGYGTQYVGERHVASDVAAKIDDYWLHNAMLAYRVTDNLSAQLNVNNLFDEEYVSGVRPRPGTDSRGSAVEIGDGRSGVLTLDYRF